MINQRKAAEVMKNAEIKMARAKIEMEYAKVSQMREKPWELFEYRFINPAHEWTGMCEGQEFDWNCCEYRLKHKKASIQIELDASQLRQQIEELKHILALNNVSDHVFSTVQCNLLSICDDIIFSDHSFTTMADGSLKIIQSFKFGFKFELLTSALRANKIKVNNITHE